MCVYVVVVWYGVRLIGSRVKGFFLAVNLCTVGQCLYKGVGRGLSDEFAFWK